MSLEVEIIMPKGYDPDGPNASRESYARAMAAEARDLYSSIERFVVIFATIRDQRLYQLLGYATITEFAFKEYGVSNATANRWVVQGRAIAEIDAGDDGSSVGLSEQARESNPTVPMQRVTDEARLSQREAARQAQAAREQSEERRLAREAQEAARKAKREEDERRRAEVEAAEPEVLVARPVQSRGSAPKPERAARMSARDTLNRLLGVIESVDDGRVLVNAATAAERSTIAAFGALFARKPISAEVVSEKDCVHPVGRRLGKDCGMCGARNVGKK